MNLAALLVELGPLLVEPDTHYRKILALLGSHHDLAEFEVARLWAAETLRPIAVQRLKSRDPRERAQGAEALRYVGTRSDANLLRKLSKDPDIKVRSRAHVAVGALGIAQVSLPDARIAIRASQWSRRKVAPVWNITGWRFGLYPGLSRQVVKLTKRVQLPSPEVRAALPKLATPAAVAKFCGYHSPDELTRFLRPGAGVGAPYVEFTIPKATGGERIITAPREALKTLQRKLLHELLVHLPVHAAAHGFVTGRSVVTNATPHVGARVVVKLDVEDFFGTVHFRRVAGLFQYYGYTPDVSRLLAGLTTHRAVLPDGFVIWPGSLPQGAPTSPALANLVCRRMDARLTGLATAAGAAYTRYADDLTFSFREEPTKLGRFLWWVDAVLQQEGFTEKSIKRRILRAGGRQQVTGVVVNTALSVPREARRRFRAVLHNVRKNGLAAEARGHEDFAAVLHGFAGWVHMVQPEEGTALIAEVRALLGAGAGT